MKRKRRIDPWTKEEFVPRRSNQKFANAKNKSAYNNDKAKKKRKVKAQIHKALDKNWKILLEVLNGKQKAKVKKDYLLGAGFNFRYYTGASDDKGFIYHTIYDLAYTHNGRDIVEIRRVDNETS